MQSWEKNMDDVFTGLSSPDYSRMRVEADEETVSTSEIVEPDSGSVQHDYRTLSSRDERPFTNSTLSFHSLVNRPSL